MVLKIKSAYLLLGTAILLLIILFTVIILSFNNKQDKSPTQILQNPTPILLRISPMVEGLKQVTIFPNPGSLLEVGQQQTITFTFVDNIDKSQLLIAFYKRTLNQSKKAVNFTTSYEETKHTLSLRMNEATTKNTEYNIQILGPVDSKIKGRANRPVYTAVTYNSIYKTPTPIQNP